MRQSFKEHGMSTTAIQEIRLGAIKCSIFCRNTRMGDHYTVSIARLYKNGDRWQESTRFGRDDLLLLAKVSDLAHSWIFAQRGNVSSEGSSDE
jgi:hypothetical protein